MGSVVMGGMARQGATRAVRRMMGAINSRAASPTIADRGRDRVAQERATRVTGVRVFRQSPAPGSFPRTAPVNGQPGELSAGTDRRMLGPGDTFDGSGSAGRGARAARGEAPSNGRVGALQALSSGRSKVGVRSSGRVSSVAAQTRADSGRAAGGSDARKDRHLRKSATPAAPGSYEPRSQAHAASLRDGPSKQRRTRPGAPAPRFRRSYRDYSSVTKDGVTVLVPGRR
jgi:hypothetical protein